MRQLAGSARYVWNRAQAIQNEESGRESVNGKPVMRIMEPWALNEAARRLAMRL